MNAILLFTLLAAQADDPAIVGLLRGLGDRSSALLPPSKTKGRGSNDYSLRMAYAPERQAALYAGGNHNDGRRNDCWEYHLGSNAWRQLHPAEGGDHYFMKGVVMFRMREAADARRKGAALDTLEQFRAWLKEADRKVLDEKILPWWKEHMDVRDGMIATPRGGPFLPSHTWDGLDYDPVRKRLVWSAGAGPNGEVAEFHALVTGLTRAELEKKLDPAYTSLWTFDAGSEKWARYRKPKAGPCPDLRGMGQSLVWMPDRKQFLWYVAAANVSPHSYQMWTWDPAADRWEELKPNGGKSIGELAKGGALAPDGEQVVRYRPKSGTAYGFQGQSVYAYDVASNAWSKAATDPRIDAHDAESGIVYDEAADVFVYTRKTVKDGQLRLAVFDPSKRAWEAPEVQGPPVPKPQWGKLKCFYHPVHNVTVIADGESPVWVYRHRRAAN